MRSSRETEAGKHPDIHISGAEGIYNEPEISRICSEFVARALSHSRGTPDKIILTIEKIKERPVKTALLTVRTLDSASPDQAWHLISGYIRKLGISARALDKALNLLKSENTMRGAALIAAKSGRRLEPDSARGVRVSRLGIDKTSGSRLSRRLSAMQINTPTVREALILASKVASCKDILAEICMSDDPDYTTGYVASRSFGYLRLPNIKYQGGMNGGRVFFIRDDADIEKIKTWLERKPVIVELGHDK